MTTTPTRNRLLSRLPAPERARLDSHLELVPLPLGTVLCEQGALPETVYFIEEGIVSLVSVLGDHTEVEVAMIGFEGLATPMAILGQAPSLVRVVVQVEGKGCSISASTLRGLLPDLPVLARMLQAQEQVLLDHAMWGAACNAAHSIRQRLARWLLQIHDRVDGDPFVLTHDFLGEMLAVARPSISVAMGELREREIIRYSRGRIRVKDREALVQAACECVEILAGSMERYLADER